MADLSELPQDQMLSGAHFDEQPQEGLSNGHADEEIETPILVVGGGPVGMLLAYTLSAYHGISCTLVEQSPTTTKYPKMEYTNHRSMEIYRRLGIADQLRAMGVDSEIDLRELIATGLGEKGKLITTWERPSPADVKRTTTEANDGTGPCETYVRCHQIPIEKWLKGLVESQERCQSRWNCKFVGLGEDEKGVVSELKTADGKRIRVRSKYVVGCDGAGSLVRKAIGRESKRQDLNLDFVFVFFKSRDPVFRSLGRYWHCNLTNGGLVVDQSNDDWTLHWAAPPGTDIDPANLDPETFVSETLGGLGDPVPVKIDEVYVKGRWGCRIAIADSFQSGKGRVFLAGDAAHQLSPVGGHGLNTGIGDVWDISWKLAAVLDGWGGSQLLASYDKERRPIAHSNLANVMRATEEVAMPMFRSAGEYGDALTADSAQGEKARSELAKQLEKGHWLHNQQGKILGLRYNDSPIIIHEPDGKEPPHNTTDYFPSTWPGARPPHVIHGRSSIFDRFGRGYTLIEFCTDGARSAKSDLIMRFEQAAERMNIPLETVHVIEDPHIRKLWERDVVLIRPDGHVAWRCAADFASQDGGDRKDIDVGDILRRVSGHGI